jgi:hypothetical protein
MDQCALLLAQHRKWLTKHFSLYKVLKPMPLNLLINLMKKRNFKLTTAVIFSWKPARSGQWSPFKWRAKLIFFGQSLVTLQNLWAVVLSGLVFFTIRWWNPATFEAMHPKETPRRVSWPYGVEDKSYLLTWLFWVPLFAYTLWQALYFLIVNVLRRQRLLRDPEVMTSYRFWVLCEHGYLHMV